jgi:hypothetical protein
MRPAFIALCLVVVAASRPEATILVSADLPELVVEAKTIVQGRVLTTESRIPEGSRTVETVVTLAAEEYLKGDLGARVTLRVPGGQIGFRRSVVVGAPVFVPGDQVVLFLGGAAPSLPWVLGLNQGVYRIRSEGRTFPKGRMLDDLRVEQDSGGYVRPGTRVQPLPLDLFKARVRALVRAGGGR